MLVVVKVPSVASKVNSIASIAESSAAMTRVNSSAGHDTVSPST